jgi:hypothetical protein
VRLTSCFEPFNLHAIKTFILPRQARITHSTKREKGLAFFAGFVTGGRSPSNDISHTLDLCGAALATSLIAQGSPIYKTSVLFARFVLLKRIILPRQARDRRRKTSKPMARFRKKGVGDTPTANKMMALTGNFVNVYDKTTGLLSNEKDDAYYEVLIYIYIHHYIHYIHYCIYIHL